jgi:putative transposase
MARSIRIEYPGAFYHVMARGNRRENIFMDDDDRRFFLKTLSDACGMTGWRVHAWVLMGNHYHLLLETPEANLVEGMKWLQNAYTRRFNVRHGLWGRLFGDRYKSVLVEGEGYYYETLVNYIHLNPVRARLVNPAKGEGILDYRWSSVAGGYALPPGKRAKWLAAAEGLARMGLPDTTAGRRRYVERLDRILVDEGLEGAGVPPLPADVDARCSHLRRGWYWGSQEFAERMLKLGKAVLGGKRSRNYTGSLERRAHGEKEALELLEEGLAAAGLEKRELRRLPGSDGRKVAIGRRIWERTTVSMNWISEHLAMKSAANASQALRRKEVKPGTLPKQLREWIKLSRFAS